VQLDVCEFAYAGVQKHTIGMHCRVTVQEQLLDHICYKITNAWMDDSGGDSPKRMSSTYEGRMFGESVEEVCGARLLGAKNEEDAAVGVNRSP
jgi:hypothetical protein